MDKALEQAASLAERIFSATASVVDKYGATAVDVVLWVTRLEAIANLVTGLVCVILAFVVYKFGRWSADKLAYWVKEDRKYKEDHSGKCVIFFMTSIASIAVFLGASITSLTLLFNIWNYVAIAKPELYLAKKAIDMVLEVKK